MKRLLWTMLVLAAAPQLALAQFAVEVTSYAGGTNPPAGYDNFSAALGAPTPTNGGGLFEGVISPFNPPFKTGDVLAFGEGGHVTLRLSNYVLSQAGPEIGVFNNVGLTDDDYPHGAVLGQPTPFGNGTALVEVSESGTSWVSLGDVTFENPANAFTDLTDPFSLTNGSTPADPRQPFAGSLSDFANRTYAGASPTILELLAGSAGGTWLDVSATGLAQVGFIRFSLPADLPGNASFKLDAVSIAHGALGAPTVPEPAALVFMGEACCALAGGRWRFRRAPAAGQR